MKKIFLLLTIMLLAWTPAESEGEKDPWHKTETSSVHIHFGAGAFKRAFTTTMSNDTTGGFLTLVQAADKNHLTMSVSLHGIQGWFGIKDGESLLFRLDDNTTVKFSRTEREVIKKAEERVLAIGSEYAASAVPITMYSEEAQYLATPDQISQIVSAKSVEIRILGAMRTVTKKIKRKKLRKIKRYLDEILP